MATTRTYSLRARYIFPIDRPPIRDGWITISQGHIAAVGCEPSGDCRDLGDVAILPALINTHTHLEFSSLDQPLGQPGMAFTQWIREVVRWRRTAIEQSPGADWRSEAIRRGLAESIRGGATSLGEIATLPWAAPDCRYEAVKKLGQAPRRPPKTPANQLACSEPVPFFHSLYEGMQGVSFLELLGLAPARHNELLASATEYIEATQINGRTTQPGLSPHAPYTVSQKLVESVAALSARTHTPVAMHLAETREELELLRAGSGPFRQLLDELGAWHPDVIPPNSTPLDYLKRLAKAHRSLIIHGNYLSHEEIEFVGHQNKRMSVIYCPRTHAYFDHDRYPLQKMLDAGVNVALGTDSRASNPDLNMLSELRFAARQHADLSPEVILRLATINAAKALGVDSTCGSLTPSKQADFIVIPISPSERSDPHERLFESTQDVEQAFRDGEPSFHILP